MIFHSSPFFFIFNLLTLNQHTTATVHFVIALRSEVIGCQKMFVCLTHENLFGFSSSRLFSWVWQRRWWKMFEESLETSIYFKHLHFMSALINMLPQHNPDGEIIQSLRQTGSLRFNPFLSHSLNVPFVSPSDNFLIFIEVLDISSAWEAWWSREDFQVNRILYVRKSTSKLILTFS